MPIRPENKARYPKDWPQIRQRIGERSGWRCECSGECGLKHVGRCNAEHRAHGYRIDGVFVRWDSLTSEQWHLAERREIKHVEIILTVAHLDHTPENCSDDNLRHMCQGCHLHYDKDHHAETARKTRRDGLNNLDLDL